MKRAVFPGSFDPITIGHEAIIKRALPLFDKIILAVGVNTTKQYLFPLEQRISALEKCFSQEEKVQVQSYEGLTVEFCKSIDAQHIIRGLRSSIDFEFEKNIAEMNRKMESNIDTVFLISEPEHSAISSTIVREIYKSGGDISAFVPKNFQL